jgi:hypothetical protein
MPKPIFQTDEDEDLDAGVYDPGIDADFIAKELSTSTPSPVDEAALRRQMQAAESALQTDANKIHEADIIDPSLSLYDAYMLEARRRVIVGYEKHTPLYISSIGAHVANIFAITSCGQMQQKDSFPGAKLMTVNNTDCFRAKRHATLTSVEGASGRDLRLHIMIVGPPAAGKAVYPGEFIAREQGLLHKSIFPSKFVQRMTSAGMFGSVSVDPKSGRHAIYTGGDAWNFCSGFLACEEFNFVKSAAGSQHSQGLEDIFLTFLEKGQVEASMKYGSYSYSVGTTAWLGNQSDRMWFGSGESGMARRMAVDYVMITEQLNAELKTARRIRLNVPPSQKVYDHLTGQLRKMVDKFRIRRIDYDPAYHAFLDSFALGQKSQYYGLLHNEETVMDRIAIGYNIMKRPPAEWADEVLTVKIDADLKNLIDRQRTVREFLFAHASLIEAEIMYRLTIHKTMGDTIKLREFVREMVRLGGYNAEKVEKTLWILGRKNLVVVNPPSGSDPEIRIAGTDAWSAKQIST